MRKRQPHTQAIFETASEVLNEYQRDGLKPTLRQLYYQLVAKNIIKNTPQAYQSLMKMTIRAREGNEWSLDALDDRSRIYNELLSYESHKDALKQLESSFKLNPRDFLKWKTIVLYEKEALTNLVELVCDEYRVDFMATRGFLSLSKVAEIKKKLYFTDEDNYPVILYMGDHDPSGMEIFEDLRRRFGGYGELKRIALNMDQIQKYNLPPNPAKMSDNCSQKYVERFGKSSWELDALGRGETQSLLRKEIESHIDREGLDKMLEQEKEQADELKEMIENASV